MTPKSILKTLILLIINLQSLSQSQPTWSSPTPSTSPSPSYLAPEHDVEITALEREREREPNPEPEFSPQYIKFLRACEKRLTVNCSIQVAKHVIHNDKFPKSCCSKLISTGPDCHVALVEGENHLARDDRSKKRITVKGDELWNKCEKLVPPPEDKDYPKLPARKYRPDYIEFLKGCSRKVTEKCANEVVYSIFKKGKEVDKNCCKKLLNMGRECHDTLVEALDNLGRYEKKGKEVKDKSRRVWKHCEEIVKD